MLLTGSFNSFLCHRFLAKTNLAEHWGADCRCSRAADDQSGDVPKIVFPDTVRQRTFEQFADMPALQAVEHSATTAAGVVGKTVAKSVVEALCLPKRWLPGIAKYSAKAVAPTVAKSVGVRVFWC